MGGIAGVQAKMNAGRRLAAQYVGQAFDVYRLNASSTGQIVQSSNKVASGVKAVLKRWTSKEDIEANVIVRVPMFEATFDPTNFKVGDVFVESGSQTYTDGGAFTYAYFRPLRTLIFVQTPIPANLTRPEPNPNKLTTGRVPFQGMNKGVEQVLALRNGSYYWAPAGSATPAAVYIGLQATDKQGSLPAPDLRLPTDPPRQTWDIYVGLLPGVVLTESDIINGPNGDRYYDITPFSQSVGLQGWQLRGWKLRV